MMTATTFSRQNDVDSSANTIKYIEKISFS